MSNQTVLMKLIERVRDAYEYTKDMPGEYEQGHAAVYSVLLDHADEMLKEERDMLEAAYIDGRADEHWKDSRSKEDFYTQTYGGTHDAS